MVGLPRTNGGLHVNWGIIPYPYPTNRPACKLESPLTPPSSDPIWISRQGLKGKGKPHTSLGKQSELFYEFRSLDPKMKALQPQLLLHPVRPGGDFCKAHLHAFAQALPSS